jgi:hypothetical protein
MRESSSVASEGYRLTRVPLSRERVPAEATALVSAWIEAECLLVDEREGVGGIDFCRMDAKAMAPLPHVAVSFFARRPYKRKPGYHPRWNGFYLLLYRDVDDGWKLMQIRKGLSPAQFAPVVLARSKAVEEVKRLLGNDPEGYPE